MKIRRGYDRKFYAVFRDEMAMERWLWLFNGIFRRQVCCVDGYYNAFYLF